MKYLPPNTLAHYNGAPQTHIHDLSDLPTAVFAEATKKYRAICGITSPNDEAVTFYVLNHCVAIIRKAFSLNEPLPLWAETIMQTYTDVTMAQGERLLHYILCITAREMRHLQSHGHPTSTFWTKVAKDFGPEMKAFLELISSHGGEETAMGKYMSEPPTVPVHTYMKAMSYAFHKSPGWSSDHESYGGPKWGHVTDAVVSMLTGVTSMEMLVDTGYTLAHNGGPIFNKGMMYSHYDHHLLTVLDVQRSGQMLDLMMEQNTLHIKKTPEAVAAAELIKQHRPEEFKGYIDWKLVDELRPDSEKNKAPSKYLKVSGVQKQPMTTKVTKPKAASVAPLASTLTIHGKKVKVVGEWQVFPQQSALVVERT